MRKIVIAEALVLSIFAAFLPLNRPHRGRLHRQHEVRGASHFNSGDFIPETILHHSS
jgi:hypothetical protein